ncbi:MAG: AmmeMemoRadiSam system protein A [Desulfosarcinaceae bacterium]|nr:AmmeMemoRadiSam system protein A [Desulfosarcinaceae bacterium]
MDSGNADATSFFSEEDGALLIRLARQTLRTRLDLGVDAAERAAVTTSLDDPIFGQVRGTFVTLKRRGELRGCIGHLTGIAAVRESVRQNAVSAGFQDPRFAPLTAAELEEVTIEISILTPPQPLSYANADELVRLLRPRVDGVILSHEGASATFLPQVWQQLPDAEKFLSHLCLKAGWSAKRWRTGDLAVSRYQVQSFEERI